MPAIRMDNDGVLNEFDLCPNTPLDIAVDDDGCEVFRLPITNFVIQITSASCIGSNDGLLIITAQEDYDYIATLSGAELEDTFEFKSSYIYYDLPAGTYQLCIRMADQPDFEQCYQILVREPEPLSVIAQITTLKDEVNLTLRGGKEYRIQLNGKTYLTSEDEITLPLENRINQLEVKTDLDCQGTFMETLVINRTPLVFPNPVGDEYLHIQVDGYESESVVLQLYSLNGALVRSATAQMWNGETLLDMNGLNDAIYMLNVELDGTLFVYRVVKI